MRNKLAWAGLSKKRERREEGSGGGGESSKREGEGLREGKKQ